MKKILIIAILIASITLLAACTSHVQTQASDLKDFENISINGLEDEPSNEDILDEFYPEVNDEMERYASYEVDVVCSFAKAGASGEGSEFLAAMVNQENLLQEYGFTEDDVPALIDKYKENQAFLDLAESKILAQCPDEYAAMNNANETNTTA